MTTFFKPIPERVDPEWKNRSMERLARLEQIECENNELREIFKQFTLDNEQEVSK